MSDDELQCRVIELETSLGRLEASHEALANRLSETEGWLADAFRVIQERLSGH